MLVPLPADEVRVASPVTAAVSAALVSLSLEPVLTPGHRSSDSGEGAGGWRPRLLVPGPAVGWADSQPVTVEQSPSPSSSESREASPPSSSEMVA